MNRTRLGYLKANKAKTLFADLDSGTATKRATEATIFRSEGEALASRENYHSPYGGFIKLTVAVPVSISITERRK